MKISILLPYKENFSPDYPGAVSLFVYETSKIINLKNILFLYESTNYKKKFNVKYKNIIMSKAIIGSNSKRYIDKFIDIEKKRKSDLIEIHNRPNYLKLITKKTF